jgi:hypothetical protein
MRPAPISALDFLDLNVNSFAQFFQPREAREPHFEYRHKLNLVGNQHVNDSLVFLGLDFTLSLNLASLRRVLFRIPALGLGYALAMRVSVGTIPAMLRVRVRAAVRLVIIQTSIGVHLFTSVTGRQNAQALQGCRVLHGWLG